MYTNRLNTLGLDILNLLHQGIGTHRFLQILKIPTDWPEINKLRVVGLTGLVQNRKVLYIMLEK